MIRETDTTLPDGRVLHCYDTGETDARTTVVWHHGTPNIGTPPEPLFAAARRWGLRWVSYDRPGYGGSTPNPGRDIASAAGDVAAVTEALGVERFAVFGHSGGGPHALACAALLPDRVSAAVAGAGLAPRDAEGLDWFAGIGPAGTASLRAAEAGRAAKEAYEASGEGGIDFVDADWAALAGEWSWFGSVVEPATAGGPGPLIDDDLAYVAPWGFDPTTITRPVMLLHGAQDRAVPAAHSRWLAERCPTAQARIVAGEGHVSVLRHAEAALEWLTFQP